MHKETIALGIADAKGGPPRYWGKIANRPGFEVIAVGLQFNDLDRPLFPVLDAKNPLAALPLENASKQKRMGKDLKYR